MTQAIRKISFLLGLALCAVVVGCFPQQTQISGRNPDLFQKENDQMQLRGRPIGEAAAPEIYVRQKNIAVRKADLPNESGSLFNPDDDRNYLFTAHGPFNVGRYLTVSLAGNRQAEKPKAVVNAGGPPSPEAKSEGPEDELEAELLKALPELAPAAGEDPSLLKTFKMKIVHRFENGDVMALTTRRSTVDGAGADLTVQARIPYGVLASGDDLTTGDLTEVRFTESKEGELAERHSSGWEDEYSLRMSGFDESKSRVAKEIDDKRKSLEETRDKLQTQIKSVGDERRKISKEREDMTKKRETLEGEQKELKTKVDDQSKTIEDQKKDIEDKDKEIEELKGLDEKPGDKKEGG